MMKSITSTPVYINPKIILWARNRIGMSQKELSFETGIALAQIEAMESGTNPDAKSARKLAKALKIPFGFLFLKQPPIHDVRLPDLRTVNGHIPQSLSSTFIEQLTEVAIKQEWYRANQQQLGARPLSFVGKFSIHSDLALIADDMTRTLGLNEVDRGQFPNWSQFLDSLMQISDSLGVLLMRSGVAGNNPHAPLSIEEFRGFAISDTLAPVVFINGNDAIAAQTFTLAHELVHLWVGKTGISNVDFKHRSEQQANEIERFCNRVAAEILVPQATFRAMWNDSYSVDRNIDRLSRHYRVSSLVVLRQALELDKVSPVTYWRTFQEQRDAFSERPTKDKKKGGNFYSTLPFRNSKRLTRSVVQAVQEGTLSHRDAATLLGVRLPTFRELSDRMSGSPHAESALD